MQVKDVMTRNVTFVNENDTIKHAAMMMKDLNVGAIPVVEGNTPRGIITDRDITVRVVANGDNPDKVHVGEVMTKSIVSCLEDADAREAANIMADRQVRRIIVKDPKNENVVGIVALGDLAVSLSKDISGDVIREVSKPSGGPKNR